MYSDADDVVELTSANFKASVTESSDFWIVEFYAPWCGHCQKLAPEWITAATKLKGKAKVGAVNCDDEKELAKKYGITGFPTIKVFTDGEVKPYEEGRDADAITTFVTKQLEKEAEPAMSKLIVPLKYLEAYSFLYLVDQLPKVILITKEVPSDVVLVARNAPSWFSTLAVKFKDGKTKKASFAFVDAGAPGHSLIADRFQIDFDKSPRGVLLLCKTSQNGKGWFASLAEIPEKGSATLKAARNLSIASWTTPSSRGIGRCYHLSHNQISRARLQTRRITISPKRILTVPA